VDGRSSLRRALTRTQADPHSLTAKLKPGLAFAARWRWVGPSPDRNARAGWQKRFGSGFTPVQVDGRAKPRARRASFAISTAKRRCQPPAEDLGVDFPRAATMPTTIETAIFLTHEHL
jgi:hypothetical protein